MVLAVRAALLFLITLSLITPAVGHAFPFGGQITLYHVCYNETLFARLSPPVPGDYVWTRATRTYQFGPPRGTGQWLLGLTAIPFDCLWSVNPINVVPAMAIMMMGSSGPAAPAGPAGALNSGQSSPFVTSSGAYTPTPAGAVNGGTQSGSSNTGGNLGGNVLISEVFATVDAAHGTDPAHEWVELYNPSNSSVNMSGWVIRNASSSSILPSGTTVGAGSFLLITNSASLRSHWNIPVDVRIAVLSTPIGNRGLRQAGDMVELSTSGGVAVDAVSWGTNTSALAPSAVAVSEGRSLKRTSVFNDRNTSSDWVDSAPSPGN